MVTCSVYGICVYHELITGILGDMCINSQVHLFMYVYTTSCKKFQKEVGKVREQVASYLTKKLLASHSIGSIGFYLCLIIQTQFKLGIVNIHACTKETHSLAKTQDLIPILARIILRSTHQPK